jgi:hypothetical protein
MGDVLRQHRFADPIRTDQHDIAGVIEELERHQPLDSGAVASFRPSLVEVVDRLEPADGGDAQPAF